MKKIIIISGPTASGKTSFSIQLAKRYNGVIINADSMQTYKHLPILSAQPTEEEKENIEHLLFSFLEPEKNCNVGLWLSLVIEKINYCFSEDKLPIIVGGTGMYISKLINGISQIPEIDEKTRNYTIELYNKIGYDNFYNECLKIDKSWTEKINKNDKQRLMRLYEVYTYTNKTISYFQSKGNKIFFPKEYFFHINISPERKDLYKRCEIRFKNMFEKNDCLNEIKTFMKNYPKIINNEKYSINKTIGLINCFNYLKNKISFEKFLDMSILDTKHYAKRQYTWFNNQFNDCYKICNIPTKNNIDLLENLIE